VNRYIFTDLKTALLYKLLAI